MSQPEQQNPFGRKRDEPMSAEELLANLNKALPFSDEAEKSVLSSFIQDPVNRLGEARLNLAPAAFYHEANRTVFVKMCEMYDAGIPVDPVLLTETLKAQGLLDRVGGHAAIMELFTFIPSSAHYRHYLKIMEDAHVARRNIEAHARAIHEFFAPGLDVTAAITAAEEHVLNAANGIIRRMTRKTIKEAISETIDGIQEHLQLAGALPGWTTGFQCIDKATGGQRKGKVTVFAGLPSDGKSAIMQNCARAALRAGAKVGWYSLEMPLPEQTARILCEDSGVDAGSLYGGTMTRGQSDMFARSVRELSSMGADIVETDGYTATEILADIAASNYDLAVVDYLQLMEYDGRKGATREEIIASISRRMKQVAKKSGCHILTASQLNDQGKLRESRAIGQDADNVFLVHKHPLESGEGYDDTRRILFCEKNRGGKRHWQAPLLFNGPTFTFKELPPNEPEN